MKPYKLLDENGTVVAEQVVHEGGGTATVYLHGTINRPGIAFDVVDKPIIRKEIPEPKVGFGRALRAKLRDMSGYDRERLAELFANTDDPFLDDLRKYLDYVMWLYTPVSAEIRCERCNALYTAWTSEDERWFKGTPFVDGWRVLELPLDPRNPKDAEELANGYLTSDTPVCPKCLTASEKRKRKGKS